MFSKNGISLKQKKPNLLKPVSNSCVTNLHMKSGGDIFSNVTKNTCAEVLIVKVDVKGFIPKCSVQERGGVSRVLCSKVNVKDYINRNISVSKLLRLLMTSVKLFLSSQPMVYLLDVSFWKDTFHTYCSQPPCWRLILPHSGFYSYSAFTPYWNLRYKSIQENIVSLLSNNCCAVFVVFLICIWHYQYALTQRPHVNLSYTLSFYLSNTQDRPSPANSSSTRWTHDASTQADTTRPDRRFSALHTNTLHSSRGVQMKAAVSITKQNCKLKWGLFSREIKCSR